MTGGAGAGRLGGYPEILVPLETAGPQVVVSGVHWRALFGELHRLHDTVAELQRRTAGPESVRHDQPQRGDSGP
jgi:hypothetical protein